MMLYNDPAVKTRRRILRRIQTETEKRFWSRLRNRQLQGLKFHRQYSVGLYILDFYCPELRFAIELDGGQHAKDTVKVYDEQREHYLQRHGIRVLRFWDNEIMANINGVLERIIELITPPRLPLS